MMCGLRASSSKARRNSAMQRFNTPSMTTTLGHTACNSCSLESVSPGCWAKHSKTSITLGSRRTVLPSQDMLLRDGSTIQLPTLTLFCTSFPEPGIGQGSIRPRRVGLTKIPPRHHCALTTFLHTSTKKGSQVTQLQYMPHERRRAPAGKPTDRSPTRVLPPWNLRG